MPGIRGRKGLVLLGHVSIQGEPILYGTVVGSQWAVGISAFTWAMEIRPPARLEPEASTQRLSRSLLPHTG